MPEAEKITYELKSLREDSQHRTHHLDKLERFITIELITQYLTVSGG